MRSLSMPSQRVPVLDANGLMSREWYSFFQRLTKAVEGSSANPTAVAVGVSPFTYTASVDGLLLFNGGAVTSVEYQRGATSYLVSMTAGALPIRAGDSVKIIYTSAPTLTFIQD